jgi:hypothetical protein
MVKTLPQPAKNKTLPFVVRRANGDEKLAQAGWGFQCKICQVKVKSKQALLSHLRSDAHKRKKTEGEQRYSPPDDRLHYGVVEQLHKVDLKDVQFMPSMVVHMIPYASLPVLRRFTNKIAKKQEAKATRGSASRKCESPELKLQVIEDCRPEYSFL